MSTTAPAGVQTIDDMAAAKMFDLDFLEQNAVSGTMAGVAFDYLDYDGAPLYRKIRIKVEGQKNRFTVPPGTRLATYGRWRLADNKTGQLFITEGETDALTLWHHGYPALGIPGANSTGCLCHEDLAGLDEISTIFIAPDNDTAGARFAEDAVARIRKVGFAGRVCVVRLPEGIKDLNELHVQDSEGFKDALNVIMEESQAAFQYAPPSVLPWVPFPTAALPGVVASFVATAAASIGCDEAFVALPVLSVLASAVGNSRKLRLKAGWSEPSIVWTAIVGESGTGKSPAFEAAMAPLHVRQKAAMREYRSKRDNYDIALDEFERSRKTKNAAQQASRTKPLEPVADRCWCDDTTTESLAVLLQQQPRGLLCARDELSGWCGSFDRYASGASDAPRWLEMFGGRSLLVDRKGAGNIHVPRASVSLTGGIQPAVMATAFKKQYRDNGMLARLLVAAPPRQRKVWSERGIDANTVEDYSSLINNLFSLQGTLDDDDMVPVELTLTEDAKALWVAFFDDHADEQVQLDGDLAAAWSKLEGYAARLALLLHMASWASEGASSTQVDADSMRAAITLTQWFGHEAKRVYSTLDGAGVDAETMRLVAVIKRMGDPVTIRDVQRSQARKYRTSTETEAALEKLVEAGLAVWGIEQPASGPAIRILRLL